MAGNDEAIIALTNEAIALYNNARLPEALTLFEKASLLQPETTKTVKYLDLDIYYKGIINYRMGKEYYDKARQYLDPYVDFGVAEDFYQPGMMNILVVLGNMFWDEGNYLKAIDLYEKAFRAYPRLPEIPGLKNRIQQFALSPAAARPKVEPAAAPVPPDLCSDKKPERYYRFTGPQGDVSELCTTIDGKATAGVSLELYMQDDKGNLIGSMYKNNSELIVYLVKNQQKTRVLTTRGHRLKFVKNPKKELPDIQITWETYTDETKHLPNSELADSHDYKTLFTWTGTRYEDREMGKALKMNREALSLWKKGKTARALEKWRRGLSVARQPGYGLSALTELVNNYGFALGQRQDGGYYAGEYLSYVTRVDPARWQAYLNLGDLHWGKGEKEKGCEYYLRTLIVNPEYRDRETLRRRIEATSAGVAAFHEVVVPPIGQYEPHDVKATVAPYAERYATACGIDLNRLMRALGIVAGAPAGDHSRIITSGRGHYYYSATVRVFELLRAKLKDRAGDLFIVLYNNEPFSGEPGEFSVGWRLAVVSEDYRPVNTFDLFALALGEWPDYWGVETRMGIEAGVLNLDLLYAAHARHGPSPGGFTYRFAPKEKTLALQEVVRVESVDAEEE
jgi:tetratricopeptide (TPR) repeat protein